MQDTDGSELEIKEFTEEDGERICGFSIINPDDKLCNFFNATKDQVERIITELEKFLEEE